MHLKNYKQIIIHPLKKLLDKHLIYADKLLVVDLKD